MSKYNIGEKNKLKIGISLSYLHGNFKAYTYYILFMNPHVCTRLENHAEMIMANWGYLLKEEENGT